MIDIIFLTIYQIIIEIILLPLSLILLTPFILVFGFFGKNKYLQNIKESYGKIIKWWKKLIF